MKMALGLMALMFCFLLVTGFPEPSLAELQSRDDDWFGTDSITYDTETGYEWLDVDITKGISYNNLLPGLEPGGYYDGFRHANFFEVLNLLYAAGITIIDEYSGDEAHVNSCRYLATLMAPSISFFDNPAVFGITATSYHTGGHLRVSVHSSDKGTEYKVFTKTQYGDTVSYPYQGHFLVRGIVYPQAMLQQLAEFVMSLNVKQGISNSLDAKLEAALNALDDINENNDVAVVNSLNAFINAVEAQSGKEITETQANVLIVQAQAIIDLLLAQ
jgi:hypothetical protein